MDGFRNLRGRGNPALQMTAPISAFLEFGFSTLFRKSVSDWLSPCAKGFSEAIELIQTDVSVMRPGLNISGNIEEMLIEELEVNACLTAAVLYRIERQIFLSHPGHPALAGLAHLMRVRTGMEIYYSTEIGPRLNIQHGMGVVIGPRNKIGSDFIIHQGVTLGQRRLGSPEETISVGDRVSIFAGAKLVGGLSVGSDVKIAANAVLLTDAEAEGTYAGIPAKRVR